ncbi:MAG: hydroxyphenylacetyl-CoA thioesterase PaaI [Aestuariivita sp.]|nr:hydroxyphenylacetyl-CoA thioesterase PaaI [Aestuariivita sp.]MCY4201226.1 hydroxyphenylacetyl-CoA thioesterase PaaI [Aestuariivita sp.]
MIPQERAERSAEMMWQNDAASKWLGMTLELIKPGEAIVSLEVKAQHLNGHQRCHGGFIFALADSAFAFACNSYNQVTVAQSNQITYISPAKLGEMLTARAIETARTGRSGVYDVEVHGPDNRKIAVFRGQSRTIKGQHFEEDCL